MMRTVNEFLKGYGMLYDAVIESISLSYSTKPYSTTINLVLECMCIAREDEWVRLSINFHDVEEFKISNNPLYGLSTVENFCYSLWEGKTVFDFLPYRIEPSSLEEHRKSFFYLVFKHIDFVEI